MKKTVSGMVFILNVINEMVFALNFFLNAKIQDGF